MHGACSQQCMYRQQLFLQVAIAEYQYQLVVGNCLLRLSTNFLERLGQWQLLRQNQVDESMTVREHAVAEQLAQFPLR